MVFRVKAAMEVEGSLTNQEMIGTRAVMSAKTCGKTAIAYRRVLDVCLLVS